jgi:hypothetical protein
MGKMGKRNRSLGSLGFSLVEMLVALVFTGLLMAGMSQVFKSSLSSFYTSGEVLSSSRRNRMAMDMLYDDLNTSAMYLTSLSSPPMGISATNPVFYILRNMPVASPGPDDPATADQLFFYMDQPLSFEGRITVAGNSAAEIIANQAGVATADDSKFVIDCGDLSYAKQVKVGQSFILKDSWETLYVSAVDAPTTSVVTVTAGANPNVGIMGTGAAGTPSRFKHIPDSRVLFYSPGQMVRYSIKMKKLDPQIPNGIPCLVRDQGNYNALGFVADANLESIITENVAQFRAYVSVDSGATWAGLDGTTGLPKSYAATDLDTCWTKGIRAELDAKLATVGRADYTTTAGNEHWFRKIPALVRIDITTRTAVKRAEYANSAVPTATAYKNTVQSLVVVPRHFGLPIN